MITSQIIADSINRAGKRLTTYILEYPRYIHAELLTHRVFSKNAASSRAIPTQKFIEEVQFNPAVPIHWGKNQSGMQANEELSEEEKAACLEEWLHARDLMVDSVMRLNKLGLHKQITNRLLEPWFNIRIILSGTEFSNFFALRAHKEAHPDLQNLAFKMLAGYNASAPELLKCGEWHVPFGDQIDETRLTGDIETKKIQIAIARCARVSYHNFYGKDDYDADIELCNRLFASNPKHLSPTEHVAVSMDDDIQYGNFVGWKQYRKFFPDENLEDDRISVLPL